MAVMGHEMGHYVLNHIYKMLAYLTIVYVLFFVALRRSLDWSLGRWGRALGDSRDRGCGGGAAGDSDFVGAGVPLYADQQHADARCRKSRRTVSG